jgi:biotin/methionine sulfoxide reductase
LAEFRNDPNAYPLKTPSGKIEIFSEQIAAFHYEDCPPHPSWIEPAEWLGSRLTERFPLHLLSNQPSTRLHSQLDDSSVSKNAKIAGREPITMHPVDAAARGLASGDIVKVFNDRGAFLAAAVISDDLLPGVVQISTGAWYDPLEGSVPGTLEKHGNPNVVTLDTGSSRLAQAPAAQTVLVEIRRYANPPTVTAFDLPVISEVAH